MVKANLNLILILLLIFNPILASTAHSQAMLLPAEYLGFIQDKISATFAYPQEARLKGWEGIVKVRFTIAQDGRIKEIDVAESSGYPLLDAAAILAIKDASPYPFPPDFVGEEIEIILPVDYRQIEPLQPRATPDYPSIKKLAEKLSAATATQPRPTTLISQPSPQPAVANPQPELPPLEENTGTAAAPQEPEARIEAADAGAADLLVQQFISENQEKGPTPLLSTKPEELDFFLDMALKNNQPTKVAQEEIALAKLKVTEAQRPLFPALKITNYYTEGEVYRVKYAEHENKLQMEQPLDYNRKLRDTLNQAKTNLEITKKNYDRLKVDVVYKAESAYYNLVSAKMHLRQKELMRQEAQDMLEKIENLSRAGLVIPLELKSATSWFNQLELQIESINQELRMAELTMKQVLSVKELPPVEAELLEAQKFNLDLDSCLQVAFKHRPEIYLSELLVKFNQYGKKIEKDKAGFDMGLVGSYGYYSGHYLTEPWKNSSNWYAGFKVTKPLGSSTVNTSYTGESSKPRFGQTSPTKSQTASAEFALFDNMKALSDLKKTNIDLRRSLSDFEETLKTINFEVQDAYLKYEKAFLQLATAEGEMRFRRTEVDVTKARALVGEGGLSNAMESLYQLSEAQTRYVQSLANYYLSLANLKKACGYGLEI